MKPGQQLPNENIRALSDVTGLHHTWNKTDATRKTSFTLIHSPCLPLPPTSFVHSSTHSLLRLWSSDLCNCAPPVLLPAPHRTNWKLLCHAKDKVKQNVLFASELILLNEAKGSYLSCSFSWIPTKLLSSSSFKLGADTSVPTAAAAILKAPSPLTSPTSFPSCRSISVCYRQSLVIYEPKLCHACLKAWCQ